MKKKITEQEEKSLTMELLEELKLHSRRWMSAFIIVIVLWFASICGFVWYLNQYDFQNYDQDGQYNNINNGQQGDVNNGTPTLDDAPKKKP